MRGILASTTNDQEEENDNIVKPVNNANLKTPGSLVHARAGGSPCTLDREAIRLSDTLLHQGKDEEAETKTTNTSTTAVPTVLKAPGKSILKKPVADKIDEEELPKPASKETSAYHLAEKVSQFDACPHKVEEVKPAVDEKHVVEGSKQTHLPNKSRTSENTKSSDRSKPIKPVETIKPVVSIKPAETNNPDTSKQQTETKITIKKDETLKPTATPAESNKYMGTNVSKSTSSSFSQPAIFYPAQPAAISKATPKLEVKHAQQLLVVNSPLSPTLKRKEAVERPKDDIPNVFSPLSGNSPTNKSEIDKKTSSSLKSELEVHDSKHNKNMQSINTQFEKASDKQGKSTVTPSVSTSSLAPASSPLVSQQEKLEKKKQEATSTQAPYAVKSSQANKSLPETKTTAATSILKNVTTDLKKLDDAHNTHMKQIETNFKDQDIKSRQPPSTDHRERPATLGRSRFESSNFRKDATLAADSLRTQYVMEHHVPRRNETVHDVASLGSASKSPETTPKTKVKATAIETRRQSPDVEATSWRKKFERNFNASPEPFPVSKSSSNVHFSEPPVSSFKYPMSTNPPMSPSTSRSTFSDRQTTSKSSYLDKPSSKSSNERNYAPSSNLDHSRTDVNLTTSRTYSPSRRLSTTPFSTSSYSTLTSNSYLSSSPTSYGTSTYNSTVSSAYSPPSSYSLSSMSFPTPAATFAPTNPSAYSSLSSYTPSTPALERSRTAINLTTSKSSGDLQARIQATKDQHKLDIKKAMNFDRISIKPPIIAQKLPRPEPGKHASISTISSTLEKREARRVDRERVVLDKVLGDRSSRGKSDDLLVKSSSYRL